MILTYSVEDPAHGAVPPADQDPVVLQSLEETQTEREEENGYTVYYRLKSLKTTNNAKN